MWSKSFVLVLAASLTLILVQGAPSENSYDFPPKYRFYHNRNDVNRRSFFNLLKRSMDDIGGDTLKRSMDDIGGDFLKRSMDDIGGDILKRSMDDIGGDILKRSMDDIGGDILKRSMDDIGGDFLKRSMDDIGGDILKRSMDDIGGDFLKRSMDDIVEDILSRPSLNDILEEDKRSEADRADKFRRSMASNLMEGGTLGRALRIPEQMRNQYNRRATSSLRFGGNFGKRVPSSLMAGGGFGKRVSSTLVGGGGFGKRVSSSLVGGGGFGKRNIELKNFDGQPIENDVFDESNSDITPKIDIYDTLVGQYKNKNQEKENM